MEWKVPLFKTHWQDTDYLSIEKVIKRGTQWAVGPEIDQFEKKLAAFTGRKYALTFNSGTSALVAMYAAIGVQGKEVIVPSFTFIATANAVLLAVTQGIMLLEDNAHSLGVYKNDKQCGTFGVAAALSFCQNKLITTGEGGAVITDSQDIYEKMKLFRSHGRVENSDGDYFSSTKEHDYLEVGHNFRMPTMNAALGLSQLEHFEQTMALRKESGELLSAGLQQINGIKVPAPYHNSDHFYQMYTVTLENKKIRDQLQKHLQEKGIMCKVYYEPVHLKSLYRKKYGYQEGHLPQTESISARILTLPMYPGMSTEEINQIIEAVRTFNDNHLKHNKMEDVDGRQSI